MVPTTDVASFAVFRSRYRMVSWARSAEVPISPIQANNKAVAKVRFIGATISSPLAAWRFSDNAKPQAANGTRLFLGRVLLERIVPFLHERLFLQYFLDPPPPTLHAPLRLSP